jgi:hypothetical protein
MPSYHDVPQGDMYIEYSVVFPTEISGASRASEFSEAKVSLLSAASSLARDAASRHESSLTIRRTRRSVRHGVSRDVLEEGRAVRTRPTRKLDTKHTLHTYISLALVRDPSLLAFHIFPHPRIDVASSAYPIP